jgi:MoxR-like ATPase
MIEQPDRIDLTELRTMVDAMKQEISRVVVGQGHMINLVLAAILAEGHVLIEGVPGIAKTLTAKLIARAISSEFKRIQFTPDLMPSDVIGTSVFNPQQASFSFARGPVFANIVLIDEINRAPAKTQSALFEVMEERQVTVDGITHPMALPFLVIATQNPIDLEGTYRLPEAQVDRFLFKVKMTYPSLEEERQILHKTDQRKHVQEVDQIKPVMTSEQVIALQQKTRLVMIDEKLVDYIARIVHQTRRESTLFLPASPRASLSIMKASKALAAIQGRDYITPDDIKESAYPALCHRIILTPEKEMDGIEPEDVIKDILDKIEVPR